MRRRWILLALLGILVACSGGQGDPAEVVQEYVQAKVDADSEKIRSLLCTEMEQFLERETRTFDSVSGVTIENMTCVLDENSGEEEGVVRCEGDIVALYGTEETRFPLVSYRVVLQDGEWKWCGEAP